MDDTDLVEVHGNNFVLIKMDTKYRKAIRVFEDGFEEELFSLPIDTEERVVKQVIAIYLKALEIGRYLGRQEKIREIKSILEIGE